MIVFLKACGFCDYFWWNWRWQLRRAEFDPTADPGWVRVAFVYHIGVFWKTWRQMIRRHDFIDQLGDYRSPMIIEGVKETKTFCGWDAVTNKQLLFKKKNVTQLDNLNKLDANINKWGFMSIPHIGHQMNCSGWELWNSDFVLTAASAG